MYNCKNYTEAGGDVTHIGGTLIIEPGAKVEGLPGSSPAEAQGDSSATTVAGLKDDFNTLLGKLRAAGYISAE